MVSQISVRCPQGFIFKFVERRSQSPLTAGTNHCLQPIKSFSSRYFTIPVPLPAPGRVELRHILSMHTPTHSSNLRSPRHTRHIPADPRGPFPGPVIFQPSSDPFQMHPTHSSGRQISSSYTQHIPTVSEPLSRHNTFQQS